MFSKLNAFKNLKILTVLLLTFVFKAFFLKELNGFGWEHDEYLHFLDLKTVYTNFPHNLDIGLGVWSKPLFTYIYGLPVHLFGLETLPQAQILGIITVLLTSFVIYKILLKLNLSQNLSLVGVIIYNFSFLTFRSSLSVMTEPIFALFLSLGIFTLLQKRYYLSSLMIGLLVLARMEGLFFVGIWGVYYLFTYKDLCHPEGNRGMKSWLTLRQAQDGTTKVLIIKKFKNYKSLLTSYLLLFTPALVWNLLGYIHTGEILHIFNNGYPSSTNIYGNGGWTYYFESFLRLDPILFTLFVLSFSLFLNYYKKRNFEILLLYISSAAFIFLQMIFWKFGWFGTAGLLRYFVTIYPIMTILACMFISRFNLKSISKSIFYLLFTSMFLFNGIITVHRGGIVGWQQTSVLDDSNYQKTGEWIEQNIDSSERLYADFPEYIYFSDRDLNTADTSPDVHLANMDTGTYVFKKGQHRSEEFWNQIDSNSRARLLNNLSDSYIYSIK